MEEVSLSIAFTAGVITFFTPCIFPLIPPYLAFIAGLSIDEINKRQT
ncbi:MAG: cytochrome c biogenesis protein CcdA, partial [Synergistetes bacterium]|nr:cytochrome c biogenesis protein CcdA [Synergistota bacterium]